MVCSNFHSTRVCKLCLFLFAQFIVPYQVILDGIRYRIFSTGCIVGIMGLFLAIVSVVQDKKYLAASFLSLAFSLIYVTSYLYVLMNPLIISFTGKFKESYRDSRIAPPLPVTRAYVFDIGEKTNKVVYLDAFTKNKYFQENMVIDDEYTIYYEKRTKIVVGVKKERGLSRILCKRSPRV